MSEERYFIKIIPIDENRQMHYKFCYSGIDAYYFDNYCPEPKEALLKKAYKTIKGAELAYMRKIGGFYTMNGDELCEWMKKKKILSRKEVDKYLLDRYEKVKDQFEHKIMTVDEVLGEWNELWAEEQRR